MTMTITTPIFLGCNSIEIDLVEYIIQTSWGGVEPSSSLVLLELSINCKLSLKLKVTTTLGAVFIEYTSA